MAVTLLRAYGGFAAAAVVSFPDSTESALIAQGIAIANTTQPAQTFAALAGDQSNSGVIGGNVGIYPVSGISAPTVRQAPLRVLTYGSPFVAFASAGTSAVHVAGSWYRGEIFVPALASFTGLSVLNGATAGTDNMMVAVYDAAGNRIANSAVAGVLSANANTFQDVAFIAPVLLPPGRYFVGVQFNGTTATTRRQAAADGGFAACSIVAGTFGTVPASFTVPTTFTAAASPIATLY
jgi:hypothetical protein